MGEGSIKRIRLTIDGIVQGVGFRPLVYRLATENCLKGFVCNQSGEVVIEIEGAPERIKCFIHQLITQVTEPAKIATLTEVSLPLSLDKEFLIKNSKVSGRVGAVFPADLAVCDHCRKELADPKSRFFQYAFTNCTYCGPRYTVIQALPFDRVTTSLQSFSMCEECHVEFSDPTNRRFHAQTIACPRCGPQVYLVDGRGKHVYNNWLVDSQAALLGGKIIAAKGIGGFHLICDATQRQAIMELRRRKQRPRKPLALMAKDIGLVQQCFYLSTQEKQILTSIQAPILLLNPKPRARNILPIELIAPGMERIGIMLAYAPLYQLLFQDRISFLVATSGNKSGFPPVVTNTEAWLQLKGLADSFLFHDRKIIIRVDDSVGQVVNGELCLSRRSRGYVPDLVPFPLPAGVTNFPVVLGAGAELKNTFCLLEGKRALLSPHIGDIDTIENLASYQEGLQHLTGLLGIQPQLVAYDPHPGYVLSGHIREMGAKSLVSVYHHHAHLVACMAENGLSAPVIGCILDGTGYGRDGSLWGFEILVGDYIDFERIYHLHPITLPGGVAAIRQPWITGMSLIYQATQDQEQTIVWAKQLFPQFQANFPLVLAQLKGLLPSVRVSSAGRLFDGIAAILGLCHEGSYEGEAALLLSETIEGMNPENSENPEVTLELQQAGAYAFQSVNGEWKIDRLIIDVLKDIQQGLPVPKIALKFHHTLAEIILEGVSAAHRKSGLTSVVLSGGVWNNRYLVTYTQGLLHREGYTVYTHKKVPPGDGGIAFGQAVSALWRWSRDNVSGGTRAGN